MDERNQLAERFEAHRTRLQAVAYRVLGSVSEAEDAVQEAWLRLSRSDVSQVGNLAGWLTTTVGRVCLNMLRSREWRREEPLGRYVPEPIAHQDGGVDPEHEALLADSVGLALLVVLDTLSPAERIAFVLHDMFAVPFDEIAPIVGRSPTATRQLASRARRRIQDSGTTPDGDRPRQRAVVDAFLAASRGGDFQALLAVLDPEVMVRADRTAVMSGVPEVRGAVAVADIFAGRAQAAQLALINGMAGAVWAPGGRTRVAFDFTVRGGRIVGIEIVADPATLDQLDLEILPE